MAPPRDIAGQLCARCGEPAVLQGRNEPLCRSCFVKYVQTKVVKRMEQFRVRNTQPGKIRTLLLPLSFGISSLSLLYVLHGHLQSQVARTGRAGFDLHVLRVQLPGHDRMSESKMLAAVERRLPGHTYTSTHLLDASEPKKVTNGDTACMIDPSTAHCTGMGPDSSSYAPLLSSIASTSSRMDILNILLTRTVVSYAKRSGCEGVLWGDSTTRLAQKVLSETAKGRGFSLPWQIADGVSPWGLAFYYPMRDLLKKELTPFSSYVDPPLAELVQDPVNEDLPPAASRNGSIDVLMRQYFESVEDQYPSIVANVNNLHMLSWMSAKLSMMGPPEHGYATGAYLLCLQSLWGIYQGKGSLVYMMDIYIVTTTDAVDH